MCLKKPQTFDRKISSQAKKRPTTFLDELVAVLGVNIYYFTTVWGGGLHRLGACTRRFVDSSGPSGPVQANWLTSKMVGC